VDKILNKTEVDPTKKVIGKYNPKTFIYEDYNAKDAAHNDIMRDALDYCKIKSEFLPVRDYFENMVLKIYSQPEFNQDQLERVISKYTEMRINDCLLSPGFKDRVQSDNGHMYMKVLKEQIVDELKLG
jgi:hypothetical protein